MCSGIKLHLAGLGRSVPLALFLVLLLAFTASCGSVRKRGGDTASSGRSESIQSAIEAYREDRRLAPRIQKKINELFLQMDHGEPSGFAFSPLRLERLKSRLAKSEDPDLVHYRENRPFFDQVEDSGGGFFIQVNRKRLQALGKDPAVKEELFKEDLRLLTTQIPRLCFSELEECTGDEVVEARDLHTEISSLASRYPEKNYRSRRRKIYEDYRAALIRYQDRKEWSQPRSDQAPGFRAKPSEVRSAVGSELKWVDQLISAK